MKSPIRRVLIGASGTVLTALVLTYYVLLLAAGVAIAALAKGWWKLPAVALGVGWIVMNIAIGVRDCD